MIDKNQGKQIGIQTLITWIPLIPILWFVGQPVLISAVSEAMAEEMQDTVKAGIAPIASAFTVLLTLEINTLRKEIAALQFRQRATDVEWTAEDAEVLIETELEMEALEAALSALQEPA